MCECLQTEQVSYVEESPERLRLKMIIGEPEMTLGNEGEHTMNYTLFLPQLDMDSQQRPNLGTMYTMNNKVCGVISTVRVMKTRTCVLWLRTSVY